MIKVQIIEVALYLLMGVHTALTKILVGTLLYFFIIRLTADQGVSKPAARHRAVHPEPLPNHLEEWTRHLATHTLSHLSLLADGLQIIMMTNRMMQKRMCQ